MKLLLRLVSASIVVQLATSGLASAQTACTGVDCLRCEVELTTGSNMSYIEVGPQDGQAVILIHGLTDDVRS